jgi:predicted NUDIX family NTP pyrophosphohydrolase
MTRVSAGLLLYRLRKGSLQVLLVHPGGPLWQGRDHGAWSIPKGLAESGEDLLEAAKREVEEETGLRASGTFTRLSPVRLKSGKIIHAWAVETDYDPSRLRSNTFTMEWPPRSGRNQQFAEIDKAAWFDVKEADRKISDGQRPLLEELERILPPGKIRKHP